jgi:hypothetical protein
MRLIALALILATTAAPLLAQDEIRLAPSGRATSEITTMGQDSGATPAVIRLDWGQPHLRGRTLHIDSLVPYGQVWRAGANGTTKLHTDLELRFGSTQLAKGTYAVFVLPSADSWILILQRDIGQTIADYDATKDVARVPMRRRTLITPVESLTMSLIPAPASEGMRGELRMAWGNSEVSAGWVVGH